MSFTRVSSTSKEQRVCENKPSQLKLKDFRYILDTQLWEHKIVNFPLEIICPSNGKIEITNCEFRQGLIIRLDYGVSANNIFIFRSEFPEYLKIFGSDDFYNKIERNIEVDSCVINKADIIGLAANSLIVYKTSIAEFIIESNEFSRVTMEASNIGLLLEHGTRTGDIDVKEGCFEKAGIIPKKIYSTLCERYEDKDNAREASLRTIDFLLKNTNVNFPSLETSSLYYERNKIQTRSYAAKAVLWIFGYFQSPMRFFTSAIIIYSIVVFSLGIAALYSGNSLTIPDILRLSFNSFIGFSHTLNDSNDYLSNIILSVSIGMSTIFYSGLLVTLLNRFRIKS